MLGAWSDAVEHAGGLISPTCSAGTSRAQHGGACRWAANPVAPRPPIAEWTIDDIVKVLHYGRSAHWQVLARVARGGDDGFSPRLVAALSRTRNRMAVDYLSRVLANAPEFDPPKSDPARR